MTTYTDPILFVDVETTGLDAHRDALLEIAVILARPDGMELGRYESVVGPRWLVKARESAPAVVRDMHDANGLWDAIEEGKGQSAMWVDGSICGLLNAHLDEGERIRIAGNSPRLDLAFIERRLPGLTARLHHRFFDLTGIETFLEMHAGYTPPVKPESNHRAMSDVEACLAQYRAAAAFLAEIEGGQA